MITYLKIVSEEIQEQEMPPAHAKCYLGNPAML